MKRDYIGYILAVVSILIGGFVSWYYYDKSLQIRRPMFAADFIPQTIFDAKKELRLPLKVTREDGTPLEKSVHSANHVFWNAGNSPISAQDVLTPVRITVSDPSVELLAVSIARSSRRVVDCKVVREGKSVFVLSFRILEQDDGCLINVVYSGSQSAKYSIDGDIVGVRKIEARTETAWDVIKRDEKSSPILRRSLSVLSTALPWLPALIFSFLLLGTSASLRRRYAVLGVVAVTGAAWLLVLHFERQQYTIKSTLEVPAPTWPPLDPQ
jgi:hypothetical protein